MKWKLYWFGTLYNLAISFGLACLLVYSWIKEGIKGELIFSSMFFAMAIIVGCKNLLALKVYKSLETKEAHSERFGVAFIFLWVLNLLILLLLAVGVYTLTSYLFKERPEYMQDPNWIMVSLVYLTFIVMLYTICLDLKLEKKATLQRELADDILSENDL